MRKKKRHIGQEEQEENGTTLSRKQTVLEREPYSANERETDHNGFQC